MEEGLKVESEIGREERVQDREKKKRGHGARFGKRFVFTDRDKKALKWIAEQGVGTVEQLWWAIWKSEGSKSAKYAEERLRDMAKGGYIKRERVFGSGTTNYLITQKGRFSVEESYPDRKEFLPPVPRRVNDGQYRHTMALNWCRIYLEQDDQLKNWMSDRAVQSWLRRREGKGSMGDWLWKIDQISPDACFEYGGERWLFEYEATQKNKAKYQEKAIALPFRSNELIEGIIFVAATPGLKEILEKYFSSMACVIFTREELKQGKVITFLRDQKEKKESSSRKLKEEQRARVPGLRFELGKLEESRKALSSQIRNAEIENRAAISDLERFERGFFKTTGNREMLSERLKRSDQKLRELKELDVERAKKVAATQEELRLIDG